MSKYLLFFPTLFLACQNAPDPKPNAEKIAWEFTESRNQAIEQMTLLEGGKIELRSGAETIGSQSPAGKGNKVVFEDLQFSEQSVKDFRMGM